MSEIRRRGIQMIVPENHDIPKLWGFAWFEDRNSKSVCYPIPLNMIASLLRDLWLWATFSPARLDSLARRYHAGYKDGYEAGRRRGFNDAGKCLQRFIDELHAKGAISNEHP